MFVGDNYTERIPFVNRRVIGRVRDLRRGNGARSVSERSRRHIEGTALEDFAGLTPRTWAY
jgi:hypothetical protein